MSKRVVPKLHETYHEVHDDRSNKIQPSTYYPVFNDLPKLLKWLVWPIDQHTFMNFQFKRTFTSRLSQSIPQLGINYHAYDGYDRGLSMKFELYVHSCWLDFFYQCNWECPLQGWVIYVHRSIAQCNQDLSLSSSKKLCKVQNLTFKNQ